MTGSTQILGGPKFGSTQNSGRPRQVNFSVTHDLKSTHVGRSRSSLSRSSVSVDVRLSGKGNSNSHAARPVYLNHLDDEVDSDQ
jgi:hypothetical protein